MVGFSRTNSGRFGRDIRRSTGSKEIRKKGRKLTNKFVGLNKKPWVKPRAKQ